MKALTALRVLTLLLPVAGRAEDAFAPFVNAPLSLSGGTVDAIWYTNHYVHNPTARPLSVRYLGAYTGIGALPPYAGCTSRMSEATVPPHSSLRLGDMPDSFCIVSGPGVAFIHLALERGLVAGGAIELRELSGCDDSWGQRLLVSAPLPIYAAPFPAHSVALSEGAFPPPPEAFPCASDIAPVARRLNVTLLNAGGADAVFTVTPQASAAPPLEVSLGPGQAIQLNDIFTDQPVRALLVSASQPFLSYASVVSAYSDPQRPASFSTFSFKVLP
jgi:hypothetical protein